MGDERCSIGNFEDNLILERDPKCGECGERGERGERDMIAGETVQRKRRIPK